MRIFFCLYLGFALRAAEVSRGQKKSATCVACHGQNGMSTNNLWPNLAGQKPDYLIKQLQSFRAHLRDDPLMTPVSQMLSDEDIADLAAYFAGLKP